MSGLLQQAGDLSLVDLEGSDMESEVPPTTCTRRMCRVTPGAEEALRCLSRSQIFHGDSFSNHGSIARRTFCGPF